MTQRTDSIFHPDPAPASAVQTTLIDRLDEAISNARAGDPLQRVTVVTPSYFSSFYLRRSLAASGFINVEFTRLEDLADLLAQRSVAAHEGRSLTRLEGAELVRRAVSECVATGKVSGRLAGMVDQPAFLSALHRSLQEIDAEQGRQPITFAHLRDPNEVTQLVGNAWGVYQRLKQEQKLFDRTEVAQWAEESVRAGSLDTPPMRLSVGKLVLLAVSVPAAQYRMLWKTFAGLPDVTVLTDLTGDTRTDALLTDATNLDPLTPATGAIPVPEAVSATDTRSEVAGLAARIAVSAENDVPFNRMAVLYADPSYAARVRSALSLAKIPVSGPPHEPLDASPAGRFVRGLLQVAETELGRQETGDWLATCAVQHPDTSKPVNGIEWNRISKSARIAGGAGQWKRQLARHAKSRRTRANEFEKFGDDSAGSGDPSQAAAAFRSEARQAEHLASFIEQLSSDLARPTGTASWGDLADWLESLIEKYLHAPEDSPIASSAETISTLLKRIRDLDRLGSAQPDLVRFSTTVLRELSSTRRGASNLGHGVFVGNIRDAVGTRFSHVHVVGMADGTFPSPDNADPLLPDHVRDQLNAIFNTKLPLSSARKDLSRLQFLSALSAADNATLYWSRSGGPGSGEAGPAQWLIEQLRRRPGNEALQAGDLLQHPESVEGLSLAEYGDGQDFSDSHEHEVTSVRRHVELQPDAVKHWLESNAETGIPTALSLDSGRYGNSFTHWSGDLSSRASDVPSIGCEPLSASRIESFATCPLRYYFAYVLKVEPGTREDDSLLMAPDRRGTFIHAVLESYLNLRIRGNRPPGEATLDEAMAVATNDWQREEPGATGRVWELEKTEIRRQLRRWLEKEKELEADGSSPSDAELSFGRRSATTTEQYLPPFEITLEDSTVLQFAGFIDRVERRTDGGYIVLDYKTGSPNRYSKLKSDPVDRGRHMQLALYSQAVQRFKSPSTETTAGYWFVMDNRQRIVPDEADFDPAFAEERLHDVLESLKRTSEDGHFPPNPGSPSFMRGGGAFENCNYCDYNSVCPARSRRSRMLLTHSQDLRLAPYFGLANPDEGEAK